MAKSIILNFHSEQDGPLFERIILSLRSKYQLVSTEQLEQLLLQKKELKNICHISFDDGERSFYNIIYPLLKKHNVPVSLFLSPEIIDTQRNFWFQEVDGYDNDLMKKLIAERMHVAVEALRAFSFQQVCKNLKIADITAVMEAYRQLTNCGLKASMNMTLRQVLEVESSGLVTIGAHTLHHPILKNEDDKSSYFEITESIQRLQQIAGHPIRYFAYPNGRPGIDFNDREMQYLRENNIAIAFSSALEHLSPRVNMLSVPRTGFPRMGLSPSNPLIYFRLYLGKRWVGIKSINKPSEKKVREQISLILNKK